MRQSTKTSVVITVGAVAVLLALASPPPLTERPSDLRPVLLRPSVARTLSRPYVPMLVDLLWLRSLNAIGQRDSVSKNLALFEYAQTLTDLDPRFYQAYTYLGLNIPAAVDRTWHGGELASALFRKGLVSFPTDLRLHLYLGYSLMQHERRYLEAADVFASAARLPDALPFMAALATRLKAQGGNAEEGLALARTLAQSSTDEALRTEMEQRADDLEVEVQLQRVDRALDRYRTEQSVDGGHVDLGTLVDAGYYDGPLEDVRGGRIYVREADGKVLSTSLDRRMELYE